MTTKIIAHAESNERAVIIRDDDTGLPTQTTIRRTNEETPLFTYDGNNEMRLQKYIDLQLFKLVCLN